MNNTYDEAINELKVEKHFRDGDSVLPFQFLIDTLERAKKEHELLGLYQQYYFNGLIPRERKRIDELERELK